MLNVGIVRNLFSFSHAFNQSDQKYEFAEKSIYVEQSNQTTLKH